MFKKMTITMLALVLGLAGCGGDVTEPPQNTVDMTGTAVPVSYSAGNMVTNGAATLDSVVSSYTCFTDPSQKARIGKIADYLLFPTGDVAGKNFGQRMGDVIIGDGNVARVLALKDTLVGGSLPAPGASRMAFRGLVAEEPFEGYNECVGLASEGLNLLVPGLGSLLGGIFGGPSEEEQFRAKVEKQFAAVNKKLDQVQAEMRQGFAQVNGKLNVVLGKMTTMQGDVNILKDGIGAIIGASLAERINNFNGFLDNYKLSATPTAASNIVYNYFVTSSDFNQNILDFFDAAKAVQNWAVTNGQYNYTWTYQDPTRSTNTGNSQVVVVINETTPGSENVTSQYPFNYHSPKKNFVIGFGNVEFYVNMMMTRLNLNAQLFSGETLKNNNKALAADFLAKLDSTGIRNSVMQQYNTMKAEYEASLAALVTDRNWWLDNNQPLVRVKVTRDGATLLSNPTALHSYNGFTEAQTWALADFKRQTLEQFGVSVARLIALETLLRSYL